jgi:hypothetical protein
VNRYSLGTPWSSADPALEVAGVTRRSIALIGVADRALCRAIHRERVLLTAAAAAKLANLRWLDDYLPEEKTPVPSRESAAVAPNATLMAELLVTGLRTAGAPSHVLLAHERAPAAA